MRLYHFTTAKYGFESIEKQRLKIAKINELNDPFEFLSLALVSTAERSAFRDWKKDMSSRFGLLCMTPRWSHPLMWSHYAEGHKGLCLGFDVDPNIFEEVEYLAKRPTLETFGLTSWLGLNETHAKRLTHLKYLAWKYERERRCSIEFDHLPQKGVHEFINFAPMLVLREVIVGPASSVTRDDIKTALRNYSGVDFFKARTAFRTFNVVKSRKNSLWK